MRIFFSKIVNIFRNGTKTEIVKSIECYWYFLFSLNRTPKNDVLDFRRNV